MSSQSACVVLALVAIATGAPHAAPGPFRLANPLGDGMVMQVRPVALQEWSGWLSCVGVSRCAPVVNFPRTLTHLYF